MPFQVKAISTDVDVTIRYEVTGADPVTRLYGSKRYVPDRAWVRVLNGKAVGVSITGPTLLASGKTSNGSQQDDRYSRSNWEGRFKDENCPDWIADLAASAELHVNVAGLVPPKSQD